MEHYRGYSVVPHSVAIRDRTYELIAPADWEGLLEHPAVQARFDQDQYMPYWPTIWPAAYLLADSVAAWPPAAVAPAAPLVLELGCGLGLAGIVAASLGYRVILSDYDEDAVAFARENARRNGIRPEACRVLDWRKSYHELSLDRIIAADVLYESRNLAPIAAFITEHLRPGGAALLSDACRSTADPFELVARQAGLRVEVQYVEIPAHPGRTATRGRLFHLESPG